MFTFLLQTENLKQTEKQDLEKKSKILDFWGGLRTWGKDQGMRKTIKGKVNHWV